MANTDDVEETEIDEDKRYDQYTREMEYLDKLEIANNGDISKRIFYISVFAISFINISLLKASDAQVTQISFLLAILFNIAGHILTDFAVKNRREYIGLFWVYRKNEYRNKQHWTAQCIPWLDRISYLFFLSGILLFIWFVNR